ncbi:MAG TPA: thiamine pyrophosphate-dependent enzyme [Bryobacteraceae bacterium]|nr:thiamine pyrophosphate-dependent enzyme [Bryobacteraceae bacterium]
MAGSLAARGVQYVFGLPGGEIVAFIDACRRAGIRFLLTGHEASAAWMAQVVGQITGVPGVCASTLGPGATNLVTGVANAWLDRAPMLAVTAQIPAATMDTMTHQRVPLDRLFAPITKGSFAVGSGDTIALVERGMDLAAAPRPGPVHISLAGDLAVQEYHEQARQVAIDLLANGTPDLGPVMARIEAAARPIVIIGLGATPDTAPAIRAFIDKLQAPFLVTSKAKGIGSEDHPLFAGVASGMAIDRDIVETIKSADLIIGIGFDPVECDKTWFADVDVVSLDSTSMAEGRYRPLEAIGDVASLVDSLASKPKPWPAALFERRRAAIRRQPVSGLSPLRLIEELRSIFPRDGIACCDVGSHKLVMGQFWRAYEPGTFFMSNGLSGMGFGIPAAIAAQLCHPERPVLAVVGDGGMLMMVHDLVLIRELGLPILIVVLSDRSLSLIRVSEERRGFPAYGVDFTPPDFAAIAQAFGIAGRRVASIAEAKSCAEQAITQRAPFVLDVPIDYREYYELV